MTQAFTLPGRTSWEHVEVDIDELRKARVGDAWSATNWDYTSEARVVRKRVDAVETVVVVEFCTVGLFNGVSDTWCRTYWL